MNAKDVKCPICGTVNRSLDLDETDGWMECESCHNAVQVWVPLDFCALFQAGSIGSPFRQRSCVLWTAAGGKDFLCAISGSAISLNTRDLRIFDFHPNSKIQRRLR